MPFPRFLLRHVEGSFPCCSQWRWGNTGFPLWCAVTSEGEVFLVGAGWRAGSGLPGGHHHSPLASTWLLPYFLFAVSTVVRRGSLCLTVLNGLILLLALLDTTAAGGGRPCHPTVGTRGRPGPLRVSSDGVRPHTSLSGGESSGFTILLSARTAEWQGGVTVSPVTLTRRAAIVLKSSLGCPFPGSLAEKASFPWNFFWSVPLRSPNC